MTDPDAAPFPFPFPFTSRLAVCVDVKHPQAYLALGPVRALADELGIDVDWLPFPAAAMQPPPETGNDRGSRHRRFRARYQQADIERYASVQGLVIRNVFRDVDSTPPLLGLLWLRMHRPDLSAAYLERIFADHWAERLDIADSGAVGDVLNALDQSRAGFAAFASGPGPAELATLRERLVAAGVFSVPSLVVDGEVLAGRAHLPLARWLLTGRSGKPPV